MIAFGRHSLRAWSLRLRVNFHVLSRERRNGKEIANYYIIAGSIRVANSTELGGDEGIVGGYHNQVSGYWR